MQRFIIEREIPSIGQASSDDLRVAADKSNGVLADLGPEIQWVESYVTADKIFCVYLAAGEETIREHARRSGFPATRITAVRATIDPTTAGR